MSGDPDLGPIRDALREAVAARRLDEAVALHDSLPESERRRPSVRILTARILAAQGEDDEALSELETLTALGWREDVVLALRAEIEERQERFSDLDATLARLATLGAASPALHLRAARAKLRAGDAEGALAANRAAEAAGAPPVELLAQRAAILTAGGDPDLLVTTLERLVELRPGEVEDRRRLAMALARLGRTDRAQAVARDLVAMRPDLAASHETAFAVLAETKAPAAEIARVIDDAVRQSAEPPRFPKFLILHLDLPPAEIAGLVDRLCARWPREMGAEFGRTSAGLDPESQVLIDALDDRPRARATAASLAAEEVPPAKAEMRRLLGAVLEAMPDRSELTRPLVVDDGAEVLVSARGTTGTTVLAFAGGALRLGYAFEVVDAILARAGASAIYARDLSLTMFLRGIPSLGTDREETVAALRDRLEALGTRRLVVLTSSGGGLGGLACGLPLAPERIVMLSPQTEISSASFARIGLAGPMLDLVRRFEALLPPEDLDMRLRLAEVASPPDIRINFGADNPFDRAQAERVQGMAGVTLDPVVGWSSHSTVPRLIADGALESLLLG